MAIKSTFRSTERNQCDECGGDLERDGAERYCRECGVVTDDSPDLAIGSEFGNGARDGGSLNDSFHYGSGTEAGDPKAFDDTLMGFKHERDRDKERQARLNRQVRDRRRRRQREETLRHHSIVCCETIGIPDVSSDVVLLYRQVLNGDDTAHFSKSLETLALGYTYFAARERRIPVSSGSFDELLDSPRYDNVLQAMRYIRKDLDLKIKPLFPSDHLPRLLSELSVPEDINDRIRQVAPRIDNDPEISGKSPTAIAAAIIYWTARLEVFAIWTQQTIADIAGVSDKSIQKYEHLVRKHFEAVSEDE